MKIILNLIPFIALLSASICHADDKAQRMADYYENRIKERETENTEKWRDLDQRQRDMQIRDELREQRQQYEIERIINDAQ